MQTTQRKLSPTTINYLIDIAIFVAFLVAMDPRSTGIALHEWLSIAFGAAIITHLLLHWSWLVGITQRFFGKITREARLNYLINLLFFIDMTIIIFSGIMISEAALPAVGITLAHSFAWRSLHELSANLALPILGLHVALHWRWLVNTTKHLVGRVRPAKPVVALPEQALQKGIYP
ncbi:MAG: DUF4405 domain-containing protein [Caldilinea sp. CFX5]|nr:DUF4405 domain-containing protein [Caldilinea sp. CFX5]